MESLANNDNMSCAICLLLICEPVQLLCSHFFCKYCIDKLKENDPNDFHCPLCRILIPIDYKLIVNKTLETEFFSKYKDDYQLRLKEVENLRIQDNFFEKIKIFYGNTHQTLQNYNKNNSHEWKFFIRGDLKSKIKIKELIKKVEVELDPSFGGVSIQLRGEPLEIIRKGYAEFTLVFKIFWQKWLKLEPMTLEHHLNFQKESTTKVYIFKFPKELFKKFINKN